MPKSIIETAFHMKIIDEDKKNRAEEYRKETNSPEDTALIDTKALTDDDLLRVYEKIYGYETVAEPEIEDDALALQFKRTTLRKDIKVSFDNSIIPHSFRFVSSFFEIIA